MQSALVEAIGHYRELIAAEVHATYKTSSVNCASQARYRSGGDLTSDLGLVTRIDKQLLSFDSRKVLISLRMQTPFFLLHITNLIKRRQSLG